MVSDMMANMEVDMEADMKVADKVADIAADIVAHMAADKTKKFDLELDNGHGDRQGGRCGHPNFLLK